MSEYVSEDVSMWHIEGGGETAPDWSEIVTALDAHAGFFDPTRPIVLARAPGRLDLMGGIADYSGSLVLELPLRAAAWVAAQACSAPEMTVLSTASSDPSIETPVTVPMPALAPAGGPLDYARARALLGADERRAWSAYVAGAVVVLHHAYGHRFEEGIRCLLHSTVPMGKGLSSSAAVEIASLCALSDLAGLAAWAPSGRDLALLGQRIENLVVGAPCGVMDQMTSACGARDRLLVLLCQPAELEGHVPLPPELEVCGIDSGIRHAVSGADYSSVRASTFMGYRIVAEHAGLRSRVLGPGRVAVDDPLFGGYLANVTPSVWREAFRDRVPETLDGRSFLDRYGGTTDPVTRVDPQKTYAVRACSEHPVEENHRVRLFRSLLDAGAASEASRELLGELMYESHASYGACGLGSDGTDRLVELVRETPRAAGLYGAKITGGGSGGTVAVLARAGARPAIERIVERYERETGRRSAIFAGSSPGAVACGVRRLLPA